MMVITVIGCLVVAGVLAWLAYGWVTVGLQRYHTAFTRQAENRLEEFFLFLDPAQLWVANLLVCAALFVFVGLITMNAWLGGAAATAGLLAPRLMIAALKRRRMARFEAQLPDLLLSLAGALRAGSAVPTALRHIVPRSPSPLAQEFGLLLREQRMGVGFEQALTQLYGRVPTEGTALLVSALKIAVNNGGNLAETLERIANTLRSRLHLQGRIRALTSQGRLQAWVMAALPFFLALVLSGLEPHAMSLLWTTPMGWGVIVVVLVLEVAGFLLIRRIVAIEV